MEVFHSEKVTSDSVQYSPSAFPGVGKQTEKETVH